MIRKDVLIELNGYSEEFTRQDGYEIWIKVVQDKKVLNVGLPLFYYRQHNNSLTKDKEKLYETRHKIVEKHTHHINIKNKKHIAIIPIRSSLDEPLCLRSFSDTTLLDIAIENVFQSDNISVLIVTVKKPSIAEYVRKKYGDRIIVDLRPDDLSSLNISLNRTLKYLIQKYEIEADTISIISYKYPLRESFYLDKAINTMYLFDAQSVLSVSQQNANFYTHKGGGLKPFNSNRGLRLEREFIYKEAGGIHCVKFDFFNQNGCMLSDRSTHIVMSDRSLIQAETEEKFKYLEHLFINNK